MGPDSPLKVWTYGANDKVRSCLCGFVSLTFESALSHKSVLTNAVQRRGAEEGVGLLRGWGYICQDLSAVLNGPVQTASAANAVFSVCTATESPI